MTQKISMEMFGEDLLLTQPNIYSTFLKFFVNLQRWFNSKLFEFNLRNIYILGWYLWQFQGDLPCTSLKLVTPPLRICVFPFGKIYDAALITSSRKMTLSYGND